MDEEKADDMNNKILEHRSEGGKSTSLLRKLTGWPTGRSEFTSLLQKLKDLVMGSSESPSLLQKVTGWFRGNLESNSSLQKSQGCLTEGSSDVSKGKTEVVYYNNVLPLEILVKIFSYLSKFELGNVQCVCYNWRIAAHDKILWKNFTLSLSGTPSKINMKTMAALQNVNGYQVENSFLNVILENVVELRRMNCIFCPALTYTQVYSIFERYPKLESITFDISNENNLMSVKIWRKSNHLKEIRFFLGSFNRVCSLRHLLNVLIDNKNFPALTHLDLWEMSTRFTNLPDSEARDIIKVLKQRSQHLTTLNIAINGNVNDIVDAVNWCTNLQFLTLSLKDSCPYNIKIDRMTQLKHLSITMEDVDVPFLTFLHASFYKGFWYHLTDVHIDVCSTLEVHILSAVLRNVKQLRNLFYNDSRQCTNDRELQDIGNLSNLEKVIIIGWGNFTEEGMTYLSRCNGIKCLNFHAHICDIRDLRLCRMIRGMKKLENVTFYVSSKFSVTLKSRKDIDRYIQLWLDL